tara:strand:+ start:1750 stop:1860 length:111 start_codon:yes stop_codon:yes gene_type:complete
MCDDAINISAMVVFPKDCTGRPNQIRFLKIVLMLII